MNFITHQMEGYRPRCPQTMRTLSLQFAAFVFTASIAGAQLEALKTLTSEQGQEVRQPIEAKVFGTSPEKFQALEGELLEIFQSSETTLEGKQYICRLLVFCASDSCVPVLEKELLNPELSSFVRFVLQGMENGAADQALINALAGAPSDIQIGIIGTLGQMESEDAVEAIAPFQESENPDAQFAAITALGNIGGKKAVKALATANVKPEFENLVKQSQLAAVEGVKPSFFGLFSANTDKKVYAALLADEDPAIRSAALGAMVLADPAKAADDVFLALESDDSELRKTAMGLVSQLPTKSLTVNSSNDAEIQIMLIEELAVRQDPAGEAFVAAKIGSENASVKKAATLALGKIGGASAFQLIPLAATDKDAYGALCAANAAGLDEAILEAMQNSTDDKVKAKYLDCLSGRQATVALPAFAELAEGDWSRMSATAVNGMANLVSEGDFKIYAELLGSTENKKKLQALEKSIGNAAQRQSDKDACTAALVPAYEQAKGEALYTIIRSMGSIGGSKARGVLEQAMKSEDPLAQDSAVRGLCNWPDAEVAGQLLEIAKSSNNDKHKLLALRGYVRLSGTFNTEEEALPMCKQAAGMAERPEEIRMILATVKRYKSEDVINFIAPYIDNPAVVDEAGQAMIEQTWHWKYKLMAVPHLEHYVTLTKNEQMKAYALQTIETAKN